MNNNSNELTSLELADFYYQLLVDKIDYKITELSTTNVVEAIKLEYGIDVKYGDIYAIHDPYSLYDDMYIEQLIN